MKLNHNKKSVKISLNLFALYAVMVCGIVFALPAFAADDPLVVVENLSTFIFSLIRAVGLMSQQTAARNSRSAPLPTEICGINAFLPTMHCTVYRHSLA